MCPRPAPPRRSRYPPGSWPAAVSSCGRPAGRESRTRLRDSRLRRRAGLRLAGPFETTTASVSRYVVTERLEPGPSALLIIISQHLLSLLSSGLPIQTNTIATASHNKIKKKAWLADGWTGLVAGTGMMQVRSYKQSEIPIWTEWSIN